MRREPDCDAGLVLRATLLTIVLTSYGGLLIQWPLLALAVLGLLSPRLSEHPALFWGCAALLAAHIAQSWPDPDNHIYLLVAWCIAVALALGTHEPSRILPRNGRLLVAATFAVALCWKVLLSPDFTDGTFFRVMLSTDPRFVDLAVLAGGLDERDWVSAAAIGRRLSAGADSVALVQPRSLVILAGAMTAWTLAIETWVVIAHAASPQSRPGRTRVVALAAFIGTTYVVAPVEGFGWTLVALLSSQTPAGSSPSQKLVLFLFIWILTLHYLLISEIWAGWVGVGY